MPKGKQKFELKFEDVVPKMMELIGAKTNVELSKHLGITPQSITNFKTKGSFPVGLAIKFWLQNNVPIGNILPIKGEHLRDHLAVKVSPQESQTEARDDIKEMVVPYGLPPRQGIDSYRIALELLETWVDEIFPAHQRPNLIASIVDSDNMEPTLTMHSIVIIDTNQNDIRSTGIFAFQEEGHLAFRRLYPRFDGNIDVINDNHAYPSPNVPLQSLLENPKLKVAGRVIFLGNKI